VKAHITRTVQLRSCLHGRAGADPSTGRHPSQRGPILSRRPKCTWGGQEARWAKATRVYENALRPPATHQKSDAHFGARGNIGRHPRPARRAVCRLFFFCVRDGPRCRPIAPRPLLKSGRIYVIRVRTNTYAGTFPALRHVLTRLLRIAFSFSASVRENSNKLDDRRERDERPADADSFFVETPSQYPSNANQDLPAPRTRARANLHASLFIW